MPGCEHQGVAAAPTEADHPDPPRAVFALGCPGACGVEVAERLRLHARSRPVAQGPLVHRPVAASLGLGLLRVQSQPGHGMGTFLHGQAERGRPRLANEKPRPSQEEPDHAH
jgi:hypothetical protein